MSGIRPDLSVEYSLIRMPYDAGVRSNLGFIQIVIIPLAFKGSKKTIEKEMSSILNSIIGLKKEVPQTKTQTTTSITNLITRLKTLKRRLDENYHEEDEIYECCKKRLLRLSTFDFQKKESVHEYLNTRVNHLIIEHLARNDCTETVKSISKEYNMEVIFGEICY